MISNKDFALAAIGIFYVVIGVRGYDLGSLVHWKYYFCIALGVLFILGALYRSDKQTNARGRDRHKRKGVSISHD